MAARSQTLLKEVMMNESEEVLGSRLDNLKETIDDHNAKIGERIHALLLLLRSGKREEENLHVHAYSASSQLPESPDFNRPEPKPNYVIKATSDVTEASSPLPNHTIKFHQRISLKEIEERRLKGLCLFCEESETPYHYLRHKNSGILMIDCDEDQSCDDEELVESEVATESIKTEHGTVKREAIADMILANLKDESMPHFQNENPDLRFEVEGDVERGQKVQRMEKICSAHQVFGKMSRPETLGIKKKKKGFISWRFKFKHRVAPIDSKSSVEVKMKQKTSKEYPYKMLLEGRFEVPTSTDLLLSKERDSPPEVAIGCELEAGERDTWIDQNQLIQEEAKNHSTDSFHETSVVHHMTSLLKHQVSISHWEFRHRSPIECLDVYEELPSASIGRQVFASLPLKTKLLRSRRMTTFSKNWCFKFKELDVRQDDVQNAFIHMSAIETRYATTLKDVRLMRQTHKSRMWCEVWLIQTFQDPQQFTLGEFRFQIKHKWRFKLLHLASELKFSLESVACVSLSDDQCDHCVVIRTRCVWTTQMQFGSESNHVWHRWKARYSQNFDSRVWDPGG